MPPPRSIQLSDILLPREHGGWSIALEPVALGLLAAPSGAGAALAVAVLALFLARRPMRLWRDRRCDTERRGTAAWLALTLMGVAAMAGLAASWRGGFVALWPLLLSLPAAAWFVYSDLQGTARAASGELAGTTAFALLPMAFGTLAKLPSVAAVGLAVAMAVRLVPTVLVLRAYLRRQKGQPASSGIALGVALAGVGVATVLSCAPITPGATPVIALLLFVRAVWLLGPCPPRLRASLLGGMESVLGAGSVLALAFS